MHTPLTTPASAARAPAVDAHGRPGRPLGAAAVTLTGGLLADWQQRNRSATIPHAVREIRRARNLENFRRVADALEIDYSGSYPFLDTDVYKTLEGIVYEIARSTAPDEAAPEDALAFYEEAVDLIVRTQAPDGYLGTRFQGAGSPKRPWEDLAWGHEMYNLGHLTQAAVAASRQLGDRRLLDVACRFADLVVRRYGPQGQPLYCGHPEVEMALVELHRETGEPRYLEQARLFVDRRGARALRHSVFPADYFQDAVPLRELDSVTGHAVRMAYLAAGATDVALETGDDALLGHLERLWDDMVATKSYVTGGVGARHSDEAFGDRYELPSERAYAETCAAIGVMQWGWRLFLATGRADVLDHVERVLFNAYAAGLSLEGTAFLYDNPLQRRPDHSQRSGAETGGEPLRRAWFGCPCCPPNVVRWMSQLQDHLAVADERSLTLAMYAGARIDSPGLEVEVVTDYPWHGRVRIDILRAAASPVTLRLRVPAWAAGAVATLDGTPLDTGEIGGSAVDHGGWLDLTRHWEAGQRLVLDLPMQVRAVTGHPHMDAVRGCAALLRGPIVLCVEQSDSPVPVDDLVLTDGDAVGDLPAGPAPWHALPVTLGFLPAPPPQPYPAWTGEAGPPPAGRVRVGLLPYALWGNREVGAMRVWLPIR